MKRNILIFIVSFFILGMNSCEKEFLNKQPLDIISENVLWEDENLIALYIDKIYEEMMFLVSEVTYVSTNAYQVWGLHDMATMSDEGRHAYPWYETYTKWGRGLIDENGGFAEYWLYPTIRKANETIERLADSSLDEDAKTFLSNRARWARAMCYFAMVKRYGGVPLITWVQNVDDPEEELYVSRNKEIEIYDFIISEMDAIAPSMPDNQEGGSPSKWAAYSLKSRAALYAASIATWGTVQLDGLLGIPAGEATRFWQASYDASDIIINEGDFSLYNKYPDDKVKNYRQAFVDEVDNPEFIYTTEFTGISEKGHGWDMFTGPQGYGAWAGSCITPYLEMIEEYENIDGTPGTFDKAKYMQGLWTPEEIFANKEPRFHADIITQNSAWQGTTINLYTQLILPDGSEISGVTNSYNNVPAAGLSSKDGGASTGFTVIKYVDESHVMPCNACSKTDWEYFRLGEIILNKAEACIELNKPDEALDLVNQIRERAGVALLTSIDREKVRHERKIELAFENGHRWFDARRWRTAVNDFTKEFKGLNYKLDYNSYIEGKPKFKVSVINNVDGDNKKVFLEKMYYLPITTARILNNPALAPENPGY